MRGKCVDSTKRDLAFLSCLAYLWMFNFIHLSTSTDTLTVDQVLRDGQVLESRKKYFRLGFSSPFHSSNRYLAIRCMDFFESKMVWVANRENPLNDTSGYLNLTREGYLMISNEKGAFVTINSGEPALHANTSLTLLDSGNLVLKSGQRIAWQSFNHPTDTILPGMKIGLFDLKSQNHPRKRSLASWHGLGAPSAGAITLGFDSKNPNQLEVQRRGIPYWRGPAWDKRDNQGYFPFAEMVFSPFIKFSYISNENETYFSYNMIMYTYSWIELNSTGDIRVCLGNLETSLLATIVACDGQNDKISKGCLKQKRPKCSGGDEFVFADGIMEEWTFSKNMTMSLNDCEEECRYNCSCMAYASFAPDKPGCKFSKGPRILDIPGGITESFYIRKTRKGTPKKKQQLEIVVGIVVSLGLIGLVISVYYIIRKKIFSQGITHSPNLTHSVAET